MVAGKEGDQGHCFSHGISHSTAMRPAQALQRGDKPARLQETTIPMGCSAKRWHITTPLFSSTPYGTIRSGFFICFFPPLSCEIMSAMLQRVGRKPRKPCQEIQPTSLFSTAKKSPDQPERCLNLNQLLSIWQHSTSLVQGDAEPKETTSFPIPSDLSLETHWTWVSPPGQAHTHLWCCLRPLSFWV